MGIVLVYVWEIMADILTLATLMLGSGIKISSIYIIKSRFVNGKMMMRSLKKKVTIVPIRRKEILI